MKNLKRFLALILGEKSTEKLIYIYQYIYYKFCVRILNKRLFNVKKIIEISKQNENLSNKIAFVSKRNIDKDDNYDFFIENIVNYHNLNLVIPFKHSFTLYSPNIAVIDFLLILL